MIDIKSLYTATTADLTTLDMSVLCEWRYGKKKPVFINLLESNEVLKTAIAEIDAWTATNMPILHDLLSNSPKYKLGLSVLIAIIIKAQQEGKIENARYKEFKDEFASLINDAFNDAKAQLEKLHGRREIDARGDMSDAIVYDRPSNLHEIGSAYKKFTKLTKWVDENTDPAPILFGLTNLLDEVYVFHVANKELKEIITATVRKKAEPNLDQGEQFTCSCCFRPIRLQNKKSNIIAYHGFTRDWYGITSTSCKGSWYEPFEKSCEGTLAYLKDLNGLLVSQKEQLAKMEQRFAGMAKEDEEYKKVSQIIRSIKFLIEKQIPSTQEMLLRRIKDSYPDQHPEALELVELEGK